VRTTTARAAEQDPRYSTPNDLAGNLRRGELAAGLATAALIVQLLLAPVTLLFAATLIGVGRVSRWHPLWLLAPTVAGLIWLLEAGTAHAAASLASSSRTWTGYLLAVAAHPARLAHPGNAIAAAAAWRTGQLPLSLLAAAAEASTVLWLLWWRTWQGVADHGGGLVAKERGAWSRGSVRAERQTFRPALVMLLRRRVFAAALSAGRTVTTDGCALGLQVSTGRLAGVSWEAAENGVLLTGASLADLDQLGLAALAAALRLRKTVLFADLTSAGMTVAGVTGSGPTGAGPTRAGLAGRVTALASAVGVAAGEITSAMVGEPEVGAALGEADPDVVGLMGRAIRRRGVVCVSVRTGDTARQVIDDVASVLADLRNLGLRGDCLVWISGCEVLDQAQLAGLLGLGPETGTAVLLSTTNSDHAAGLAPAVGTIIATGPISGNLAAELSRPGACIGRQIASAAPLRAALATSRPMFAQDPAGSPSGNYAIEDILRRQSSGVFTMIAGTQAGRGHPCVTASCRAVRLTAGDIR
jgi:hypothetical protein